MVKLCSFIVVLALRIPSIVRDLSVPVTASA
jgi:hypothetical protein